MKTIFFYPRKIIIVLFLIANSMGMIAQEEEHKIFLETDSTWRMEIFKFPINFAPTIPFEGVEEAQFPLGWGKKDSPEYWSYVFAWKINIEDDLTASELEENLQIYFDGLMSIEDKRKEAPSIQNSLALLIRKNEGVNASRYLGKIRTFDAFFTKQPMTLNVQVDQFPCPEQKKSIIIFRFSPQDFDQAIWQDLEKVILHSDSCDH